ncbi:MAG: hypothetical protein ACE5HF_00045 [Gemmatimonadota bacterium]
MIPPRSHLGRTLVTLAALAAVGCGGATGNVPIGARPAAAQGDVEPAWADSLEPPSTGALPPVGYGTLNQDDITVFVQSGDLQVKAVPLAEWVIRLTAPDTYRRLNGYKTVRAAEILERSARGGEDRWPLVLFVTLFTREIEDSYQPFDLQIRNQNRIYRPIDILAVTPDYDRGRIRQEDPQIALYLFPAEIDLELPTAVLYQGAESRRWDGIRARLDAERSRVLSRAGAEASGS